MKYIVRVWEILCDETGYDDRLHAVIPVDARNPRSAARQAARRTRLWNIYNPDMLIECVVMTTGESRRNPCGEWDFMYNQRDRGD